MSTDAETPESHEQSAAALAASLGEATALMQDMFLQLQETDKFLKPSGPKDQANAINRGPKAQQMKDLNLQTSADCIRAVEDALGMTGDCQLHLQHERSSTWSLLKACEWRLELRSRRPPKENWKDHVQEALHKEKQILESTREEMKIRAKQVADMMQDLQKRKNTLGKEMGVTRLANSEPPSSPSSPAASLPKEDTQMLVKRALQICKDVPLEIGKATQECAKAGEKVITSLNKKIIETTELKNKVEHQVMELSKMIQGAERTVLKVIRRNENPEGHCKEQIKNSHKLLDKLRAKKQDLDDELRCKMIALKIDESCKRTSPEKAAVMQEGALKRASSSATQTMKRTMSAPMGLFGGTSETLDFDTRPVSQAGASKSLKAAAAVLAGPPPG